MTTFSELLGGQAAPRFIDHNGRRFECGALTQKRKTQLERLLEHSHRQALADGFAGAPAEAVAIALERFGKRVLAGEFKFGGLAYQEWLSTPDGLVANIVAFFGATESQAMELALDRGQEVGAMITLSILESLSPAQRKAFEDALKAAAEPGEPAEASDPNS